MPWKANAPNFGFSDARPWLPIGTDHGSLTVDRQEDDPYSTLAFARDCIALRNRLSALRNGAMNVLTADEHLLCFERESDGMRLLCTFNLSNAHVARPPQEGRVLFQCGKVDSAGLGPFSAVIEQTGVSI